MIPRPLQLVILVVIILGAALVTASPERDAPPSSRVLRGIADLDGAWVGKPVPDGIVLTDRKGKQYELSKLRGKVVFLNLWATWCPPCLEEMPAMAKLAQELSAEPDFLMIAVSWDEDQDALEEFLRLNPEVDRSMVISRDPSGALTNVLGTRQLPETYIIDRDGRILARFQGARDWTNQDSTGLLLSLLRTR